MDHSIYGYLSRRSKKELEDIITLYAAMTNDDYYKQIVDLAMHFLEQRIAEENA